MLFDRCFWIRGPRRERDDDEVVQWRADSFMDFPRAHIMRLNAFNEQLIVQL